MVERQLRRRGIEDERVLAAMGEVPREEMTSVVLDEASRTSQLLVQLLLRERGLAPALERAEHDSVVDRIGGQRVLHLGYRGAQELYDRIVNALLEVKQETSPIGYAYL